jgi:hypothetical protein
MPVDGVGLCVPVPDGNVIYPVEVVIDVFFKLAILSYP